jgi:hypothetical protein
MNPSIFFWANFLPPSEFFWEKFTKILNPQNCKEKNILNFEGLLHFGHLLEKPLVWQYAHFSFPKF